MKQTHLILTGVLMLVCGYWFFQKSEQPKIAVSVELPASPQKLAPRSEPAPRPAVPSQPVPLIEVREAEEEASEPPDTQEFLKLVTQAPTPEQVFETPANHVIAVQIDGQWIAQGDLLVDEKALVKGAGDSEFRIARLEEVQTWKNNLVPYRIDPAFNPTTITRAVALMNQKTHVRFVEHTNEIDYIYFRPFEARLCLSHLGRKGGEQDILLDPRECSFGNILHEMMHALGFVHEHSREDRDNFLIIHWHAIETGAQHQFQKMKGGLSFTALGPFDFHSILLYPSQSFSLGKAAALTRKDGTRFEANRAGLSPGDIAKVNKLYPKVKPRHEY